MKSPKIIIPLVAGILAAVIFFVWQAMDHGREFGMAVYSGNVSGAEELLRRHPGLANSKYLPSIWSQPNRLGTRNWTPLHAAAAVGNPEMIKLLLRYHARLEAKDDRGLTPLLCTTFAGRHEAALALISGGADINARGKDGRTALELAKLNQDREMIALLRQWGAKE